MKFRQVVLFFSLIFFAWAPAIALENFMKAKRPKDFTAGKKAAYNIYLKLYPNVKKSKTFYCNCQFLGARKFQGPCSLKKERKLSWEHLVPAVKLGQAMGVWPTLKKIDGKRVWVTKEGKEWKTPEACIVKKGKRAGKPMRNRICAAKISEEFKRAEGDLYNLVPAILGVNKNRKSYPFAAQESRVKPKNGCMLEVKGKGGNTKAYAAKEIQGNIARAYLYMDEVYTQNQLLTPKRREEFMDWSHFDPPTTKFDCKRAAMIYKATGQTNPFTVYPCLENSFSSSSLQE